MKHKIGILGAGTWGMALARMLTVSGNDVTVWSALEQEIDNLSTTRVHPNLPGMTIPAEMKFTKSVEEVCTDKEILLFAVPSVFVRSTAAKARPFVPDGQIIVDVAKGIEKDTLFTMTEILADELGKEGGPKGVRLVALSGPTHAEEVAIDLPTTIVSASKDMEAARFVQTVFTNNVMRVYTNEDIKGVELSGAMKLSLIHICTGSLPPHGLAGSGRKGEIRPGQRPAGGAPQSGAGLSLIHISLEDASDLAGDPLVGLVGSTVAVCTVVGLSLIHILVDPPVAVLGIAVQRALAGHHHVCLLYTSRCV